MCDGSLQNLTVHYNLFKTIFTKLAFVGALIISHSLTNHTISLAAGKSGVEQESVINISTFGAIGNGKIDDTKALQRALTQCSIRNLVCKVPHGKNFLVREPLYIWGDAQIIGEDGTGTFTFDVPTVRYLVNVGISAKHTPEKPFSGRIANVRFVTSGGAGGRILFFWRTENAVIEDNRFEVGEYAYSATSSGNNNEWLSGLRNYIRKDIQIKRNTIVAQATNGGSEGIGLGNFDGALIQDNTIIGVGDDPIGIHFSQNIKVLNNRMGSTHGRLYVSNSVNVEISHNEHERMASLNDEKFYYGIALLYIGFESYDEPESYRAPTNIRLNDNRLYYPEGAIDEGGAIYLYGLRNGIVENNQIVNDSVLDNKASGLHLLPARFSGKWKDPTYMDENNVARVWDVIIKDNVSMGKYPLGFRMTGNCIDYMGPVHVKNNIAKFHKFYCNNVFVSQSHIPAEGTPPAGHTVLGAR